MEADLASTSDGVEEALRAEGERIEHLLDELRGVAGPETWPRIEELVQRLLTLYGAGLERLLTHMQQSAHDRAALRTRLVEDALLSSLLVLHGLHPATSEERIRKALELAQPSFGVPGLVAELVSLTSDGAVRVQVHGASAGCGATQGRLTQLVRMAVEEAAPEVLAVHVDGLEALEAGGKLVALGIKRDAEEAR